MSDSLTMAESAASTALDIVQAVVPNPAIAVTAQILEAGLALAQQGTAVYDFLAASAARVTAAQAAGRDLTDDDWQALDGVAAANLVALKGYASVTAALLQTPAFAGAGSRPAASGATAT